MNPKKFSLSRKLFYYEIIQIFSALACDNNQVWNFLWLLSSIEKCKYPKDPDAHAYA
jgi:hypothetical protein